MEKIEKYEPNHLSLLGDMYASFPEDMDVKLRSELGLEDITNENNTDAVKTPGYLMRTASMIGRTIAKPFKYVSRPVKALFVASALAVSGATVAMAANHEDNSYDVQMIGDSDANQTITNGNYVASLEDNRFINIVDIESGSEIQIGGSHYAVGSMTMDGDVLQYTTLTLQGNEGMYRLNELDLNTGQTNILKEELSVSTPDFFTQHDTDGANNVYINDGAVVLNGETVYTIGNNSLPNVNGDSVAFVSEQTENNETTQSVVTIENGEINTIYSGNQSVEFVEFMDGQVVYGLENLIDNKTVDLYVGNSVREVPNGMFDADNGNLTWIEPTADGFSINLYNFETNQTEAIYVSSAEMRNPQLSGDLVTWEQKYGISDSFKSWYSDVADLMTFESDVPVDNGTVDNGTADNGTVDNGTVDNGTVDNGTDITTIPGNTKTETEGTDYSLAIVFGAGAAVFGIIYLMERRKGDGSDDNGGLEDALIDDDVFTDDEIKTMAGEVVDARSEVSEAYAGTDVEDYVRTEDNKGDQLEKVLANMIEQGDITDEQYDKIGNFDLDPEEDLHVLTRTEVYESRKPELRILANQRGIDTSDMKVAELRDAIFASMDEEE